VLGLDTTPRLESEIALPDGRVLTYAAYGASRRRSRAFYSGSRERPPDEPWWSGASSSLPSMRSPDPSLRRLVPSGWGEIVDRAVANPEGAYAFFAELDASTMFAMVLGASKVDTPVFADEAFRAHFRRVLDDAFAPVSDGYARDTLLAMRPCGLPLDELRVPGEIWHRQLHTGHSPDLGAALARRMLAAVHHLVPEAGWVPGLGQNPSRSSLRR
jgi:hypothetical protein